MLSADITVESKVLGKHEWVEQILVFYNEFLQHIKIFSWLLLSRAQYINCFMNK